MDMRVDIWKGSYARTILIALLIIVLSVLLYPILYNLILSFQKKHAYLPGAEFAGVSNYSSLFHDEAFWKSFLRGSIYASVSVFFQLLLGIFCAVCINNSRKGRSFFQGVVIFPYLIPTVIVVILWKWLLNSTYGLLNGNFFGTSVVWFDQNNIMRILIFISVWQFFPFVTIFVLARLRSIPQHLYQSAIADGAGPVKQFLHVTWPAIKNIVFILLLIRFIWMFTKFDIVWLLAGKGSSLTFSETLPVYAYRQTFRMFQVGMGATVSVIMLIMIVVGTYVWFRQILKRRNIS